VIFGFFSWLHYRPEAKDFLCRRQSSKYWIGYRLFLLQKSVSWFNNITSWGRRHDADQSGDDRAPVRHIYGRLPVSSFLLVARQWNKQARESPLSFNPERF